MDKITRKRAIMELGSSVISISTCCAIQYYFPIPLPNKCTVPIYAAITFCIYFSIKYLFLYLFDKKVRMENVGTQYNKRITMFENGNIDAANDYILDPQSKSASHQSCGANTVEELLEPGSFQWPTNGSRENE